MWFSSCWIITAKRSFRDAESNEAVQISYVTGDDVSIFCHGDIRSMFRRCQAGCKWRCRCVLLWWSLPIIYGVTDQRRGNCLVPAKRSCPSAVPLLVPCCKFLTLFLWENSEFCCKLASLGPKVSTETSTGHSEPQRETHYAGSKNVRKGPNEKICLFRNGPNSGKASSQYSASKEESTLSLFCWEFMWTSINPQA